MSPIDVLQLTLTFLAQVVVKSPSAGAWRRFDQYSRRIHGAVLWQGRELFAKKRRGRRFRSTPIHSVDWNSVLRYYPGDHMLPNLAHLAYNIEEDAKYAHVLLKWPLQRLYVTFDPCSSIAPLLKALPACAQTLQEFEIDVPGSDSAADDISYQTALSSAVCSLQYLVKLRVDTLTFEALEHLAYLQTLKELYFGVSAAVALAGQSASTPLRFAELETVVVSTHWTNFDPFGHLLHKISAPKLRLLTVDFKIPEPFRESDAPLPSTTHTSHLFAAITSFPLLQKLEVYQSGKYSEWSLWQDASIGFSTLSQLLVLRNLEFVSLSWIPFTLSASDLEAIASAWPHMTSLALGDRQRADLDDEEPAVKVKVDDLLPFALLCPRLERLSLPLMIPSDNLPRRDLSPVQSASELKELSIGYLDLEFCADDAAVLVALFPKAQLTSLDHYVYGNEAVVQMNGTMRAMSRLLERQRSLCARGSLPQPSESQEV